MNKMFKYNENLHKYYLDGKEIPSVSEILNLLFGEYNGDDYYGDDYYSDRGSRVHKAINIMLTSKYGLNWESLKTDEEDLTGYIQAAEKFLKKNKIEPNYNDIYNDDIHIEIPAYMETPFEIGFKPDLYYVRKNILFVVDWKTGGIPPKSWSGYHRYQIQMQAYLQALLERLKEKKHEVEKVIAWLVYLKNDSTFQLEQVEKDFIAWNLFCCGAQVWKCRQYPVV